MILKIVNSDLTHEVHSVRIEDGVVTVVAIADGTNVDIAEMEDLFPNFKNIINQSANTEELLIKLQEANTDYIWAHVSGKL